MSTAVEEESMPRRYVFWRTPTGKPYRGCDGKHAPTTLLQKIGQSASVSADGGISWPMSHLLWNKLGVRLAAVVLDSEDNELDDIDAWPIVDEALRDEIIKAGGGKPILPHDVIATADKIAAAHFRITPTKYVLVTSLSVKSLPAKTMRICGCKLSALAKRGTRYPIPDALRRIADNDLLIRHVETTKYLTVKVTTSGRSVNEATSKALDALNLLRGLWTLFATFGSYTIRMGGTRPEPIGVIQTGPFHTLHSPDGSLATGVFWYEPHYVGDLKVFKPDAGWTELDKDRRSAVREMKRLPHGRDIEQLVIRYAVALDQTNHDVSFLKLWALLERITDTVARYDDTIKRTIYLLEDHKLNKELLESLRSRRNQYVHAAQSGEKGDQVAYMVKYFVEEHLLRLIFNDFKVNSIGEYGEFLSLPADTARLKTLRDRYNLAMRLRK